MRGSIGRRRCDSRGVHDRFQLRKAESATTRARAHTTVFDSKSGQSEFN